jgi:hypothetical protein
MILSFMGHDIVDILIYGNSLFAYSYDYIPQEYSLEGVTELDLGGCKLEEIPEGLEVLFFFHNKAKTIPKLPRSLRVLDVSHNEFKTIPDLDLPNLRTLKCESNQLTILPEKLIKNLDSLFFDNNPMKFVPFLPKKPIIYFPKIENYQEKYLAQQRGRFLVLWLFEELGFHSDFIETEFSLRLLF